MRPSKEAAANASGVRETLRLLLRSCAGRGVGVTARLVASALRAPAAERRDWRRRLEFYPGAVPPSMHPFDLTYGTDTSGLDQGSAGTSFRGPGLWSTPYYGIAPSIFRQALARIGEPGGVDWSEFTFVDLGCGKGRALLLASELPFRHILGVEFDPRLASVARHNVEIFTAPWQQCRSIEVRAADATTVELPLTPLVVYLYHPFLAPALRRVLRRLERSLSTQPRELWLLYVNPEALPVVRQFPAFREHLLTTLAIDADDGLADRMGNDAEELAVFHVAARDRR